MIRNTPDLEPDPNELHRPLGQGQRKASRKRKSLTALAPMLGVALGLGVLAFLLWTTIASPPGKQDKSAVHRNATTKPAQAAATPAAPESGERTVTIIDGKSGKRQDIVIPGTDAPVEPKTKR
jgi:hypothetical protein